MGMMKRVHWDNVVQLFPTAETPVTDMDWWWMAWHADWWEAIRDTLAWRPMQTYGALDASPEPSTSVMLWDGRRWAYGSRIADAWHQVTEEATYPLESFEPSLWAVASGNDQTRTGWA